MLRFLAPGPDTYREETYESYARRLSAARGHPMPPMDRFASGDPVRARYDHGRWVVDCTDPNGKGCRSADCADPEDPRFLCWWCFGTDEWQHVKFPLNWRDIELSLNLLPENERHWNWP